VGELLSRERLLDAAARARASGRSVALASGGFDPFHVGHVRYLHAAAREADVLLVAVDAIGDADADGGHALLAAEHRAELIAALRCVDAVTVLDDATLASLIEALRPDAYCADAVSEVSASMRDAVAVCGGRLAVVGDPDGPTSEEVLARIAAAAPPGEASDHSRQ
jgi:cytidyltransferase-like protein